MEDESEETPRDPQALFPSLNHPLLHQAQNLRGGYQPHDGEGRLEPQPSLCFRCRTSRSAGEGSSCEDGRGKMGNHTGGGGGLEKIFLIQLFQTFLLCLGIDRDRRTAQMRQKAPPTRKGVSRPKKSQMRPKARGPGMSLSPTSIL